MQTFPTLRFLPTASLLIHEIHDDQRTRPLIHRIRSSGVLRNPPIVCSLGDGSDRYMVLDGANRVTAFSAMGYPHILVQVVEPDDPGVTLQTWNHVVWELPASRFLESVRTLPGVNLKRECDPGAQPDLFGDCGLALVQTCKGHTYSVCSQEDRLEGRVAILNNLVDCYKDRGRLDRTGVCDALLIRDVYPQFCGLVIFPKFQLHDLLHLAGEGHLLPSGVTRFLVAPRALHLNYPLAEFSTGIPLGEKNTRLQAWLTEMLAHKRVRYYAEPTYVFDE